MCEDVRGCATIARMSDNGSAKIALTQKSDLAVSDRQMTASDRQNCDDSTVEKTTRAPGRGRSDFAAVHRLLLMRVLYSPAAQTVRTVERCGVDAISALS